MFLSQIYYKLAINRVQRIVYRGGEVGCKESTIACKYGEVRNECIESVESLDGCRTVASLHIVLME